MYFKTLKRITYCGLVDTWEQLKAWHRGDCQVYVLPEVSIFPRSKVDQAKELVAVARVQEILLMTLSHSWPQLQKPVQELLQFQRTLLPSKHTRKHPLLHWHKKYNLWSRDAIKNGNLTSEQPSTAILKWLAVVSQLTPALTETNCCLENSCCL